MSFASFLSSFLPSAACDAAPPEDKEEEKPEGENAQKEEAEEPEEEKSEDGGDEGKAEEEEEEEEEPEDVRAFDDFLVMPWAFLLTRELLSLRFMSARLPCPSCCLIHVTHILHPSHG